jgi:hypothetical protein
MVELTDRAKANMEVVLEQTCRSLPHGGDHELRVFIAQRLADAVAVGRTGLGHLGIIARKAFADYKSSHTDDAARPRTETLV